MILLQLDPTETTRRAAVRSHRIAGCEVLTDRRIHQIEPYSSPQPLAMATLPELPAEAHASTASGSEVYRSRGLVAREMRNLECTSSPVGTLLDVQGIGAFWIDSDGRRAARVAGSGPPTADEIETILGPVLVVALALHGTYCLHSSAVIAGDRAIGFSGRSGSGKSTLALDIERQSGLGWQRLADDIMPIASGPAGPVALPRFPQLKLSPEEQPSLGWPDRIPLAALFVIDDAVEEVKIEALPPREAMLALVRQTVASRLFDLDLSARHMAFCAHTSGSLTIADLTYPRRRTVAPQVQAAIVDMLAADEHIP